MQAVAVTDVGSVRPINQDFVYATENTIGSLSNLFIVADGMGGHKAGDVASRYSVETFVSLISKAKDTNTTTLINNLILRINREVYTKAAGNPDYKGMGTTFVVATIKDNVLKIANVGDSRLYIINDDIKQITRDHSYVEELVLRGLITKEEARVHKRKNEITKAIGGELNVEPDMFSVDLRENDYILMCTDGLTNMVDDQSILRIVKSAPSIEEAVNILVNTANANGGKDNISVILIKPL